MIHGVAELVEKKDKQQKKMVKKTASLGLKKPSPKSVSKAAATTGGLGGYPTPKEFFRATNAVQDAYETLDNQYNKISTSLSGAKSINAIDMVKIDGIRKAI